MRGDFLEEMTSHWGFRESIQSGSQCRVEENSRRGGTAYAKSESYMENEECLGKRAQMAMLEASGTGQGDEE